MSKKSYPSQCAKEAGKAVIGGEKKKNNHYEKLLRNYIFVPIAVETFGSWGPKGLKFIKEIGKKIHKRKNRQPVTLSKQFCE